MAETWKIKQIEENTNPAFVKKEEPQVGGLTKDVSIVNPTSTLNQQPMGNQNIVMGKQVMEPPRYDKTGKVIQTVGVPKQTTEPSPATKALVGETPNKTGESVQDATEKPPSSEDLFNARADLVGKNQQRGLINNTDLAKAYGTSAPADGSVFGKMGLPEYTPYTSKQSVGEPPSEATSTGALHATLKDNLEKVMSKMDDIRSTMFFREHMKKSERAFWGNAMAAYSGMANQLANSLAEIEKGRKGLPMEGYKAKNLAVNESEKTGILGEEQKQKAWMLPFAASKGLAEAGEATNKGLYYKNEATEYKGKTLDERIKMLGAGKATPQEENVKTYWDKMPTMDKFANTAQYKAALEQHNQNWARKMGTDEKTGKTVYYVPDNKGTYKWVYGDNTPFTGSESGLGIPK
jgi:hypothetical protein